MDWCGRVGRVTELFRSEFILRCHWVVPKIFSMPHRQGPVYYSPSFKFMNTTWYFGIYLYSKSGQEEWIGFEICRSTDHPLTPAHFSVGLMHWNQTQHVTLLDETLPARDSVLCVNEFLPIADLASFKDKWTRSDELTITCVMCPDAPLPGEWNEFCPSEQIKNSIKEVLANTRDKKDVPSAVISSAVKINDELDPTIKDENCEGDTTTESISVLRREGTLRETSRVEEWEVTLPPSTTTWDLYSPEFTYEGTRYHFSLYSSEIISPDIKVGITATVPSDANFPLPIQWRMAVKSKDGGELCWITSGQMTSEGEHAPVIRIKRAKLESSVSSTGSLTFVCHLFIEDVHRKKEASTQTDEMDVYCESQNEGEPGENEDLEESEEHFTLCLNHPEEGDRVYLIKQKPLEASIEKYLSEVSRKDKKHFIFAA